MLNKDIISMPDKWEFPWVKFFFTHYSSCWPVLYDWSLFNICLCCMIDNSSRAVWLVPHPVLYDWYLIPCCMIGTFLAHAVWLVPHPVLYDWQLSCASSCAVWSDSLAVRHLGPGLPHGAFCLCWSGVYQEPTASLAVWQIHAPKWTGTLSETPSVNMTYIL